MSNQMKRYNILILINVRWWNATAYYAVNVARLLKERGHFVLMGCHPSYPAFEEAKRMGIQTVPLSFHGCHPIRIVRSLYGLLKTIKKFRIDIINSHRSEDHTFALLAKRVTGTAVVITRGDQRAISKGLFGSRKRYASADAFIATCRSILEQNKEVLALSPDRMRIIYGSVHEKMFTPRTDRIPDAFRKYHLDTGKIRIGLIGRLSPVKDPLTFLKAARRVLSMRKGIQFILAGKEVEIRFTDITAKICEWGLESDVILLPFIEEISEVMSLCDIGVITSTDSETISRVLFEWMFLKKPVIGTHVNAIKEIIQPGKNGELIMPGDSEALSRAIIKLADDPLLREQYGNFSRILYERYYCENVFYGQTMELFDSLLNPKPL